MQCQLHCLYGSSVPLVLKHIQTETFMGISLPVKMCRGSNVKDMLVTAFQLESLILAQNERWRQA